MDVLALILLHNWLKGALCLVKVHRGNGPMGTAGHGLWAAVPESTPCDCCRLDQEEQQMWRQKALLHNWLALCCPSPGHQ